MTNTYCAFEEHCTVNTDNRNKAHAICTVESLLHWLIKTHCFLSREGFSDCTLMVIKVATRCGKEPNRHLGCTLLQNQFNFREVFRFINEKGGSRCRISRMDDSRRCKTEENKEKQGKKTDIRHAR